MDPITLAIIGGSIAGGGALGYMMNQDDISSPTYADINLERDNPAMWSQIIKNREAIEGARRALETRRQGMTDMERRRVAESRDQLANQQSQLGLLGSSVGANAQAAMTSRLHADIAERAYQEEMQRRQYMNQLQSHEADLYGTGLNQAMQGKMGQYNNAMAEQQAKNQFWSSIMGGGIGVLGSGIKGSMSAAPTTTPITTTPTNTIYSGTPDNYGYGPGNYSFSMPQNPPQLSANMIPASGPSYASNYGAPSYFNSPQARAGGY